MKSDSHNLGGEEGAQGVTIGSSFSDKAIRRNFIRKVGCALSGSPTGINVGLGTWLDCVILQSKLLLFFLLISQTALWVTSKTKQQSDF